MLDTTSVEERGNFLLNFTRKLIRNTHSAEMYKLEEILQRRQDQPTITRKLPPKKIDIKKEVKSILSKKPKKIQSKEMIQEVFLEKSILPPTRESYFQPRPLDMPRIPRVNPQIKKRIKIQDNALPERLQYLKPTPRETPIDLKKLNPLLQDPNVKSIECPGENEKIIVSGRMGKKPTGIKLSKEEIDEIINIFSINAKIPKSEGLFKAVFGKLMLISMVSETISSSFLIKKIENTVPKPMPQYRR